MKQLLTKQNQCAISLFFLLAMLVFSCLPAFAAVSDTGYEDVDSNAWYAQAAIYCREQGLMNGTSTTVFSPEQTTTRAMLVSVLYRLNGSPAVTTASPFQDVATGAWYADAVVWAQQNGVVSGYGQGIFAPDDAVTREQIAAIIWRNENSPQATATANFADQSVISGYATEAVAWAKEQNIVGGKENNRFAPLDNASRAEVATMLYRWQATPTEGGNGDTEPDPNSSRVLVAYFSRSGNTKTVAETTAKLTGGQLFEIVPATPYPSDYNACLTQAQQELNANARPALSSHVENMAQYDTILLGFPIWYGDAPMAVRTFLEEYDVSGKTIAPFSTSASSGIGTAVTTIRNLCPAATVTNGLSITSGSLNQTESLVDRWLDGLNLPTANRLQPTQ